MENFTWENIQTFMSDPTVIAAGGLFIWGIIREIMFNSLRKAGLMKDADMLSLASDVALLKESNDAKDQELAEIKGAVLSVGTMVNTAYQNSKLSPEAKQAIDQTWSPVVGTLGDIAVKMYEQKSTLIEDTLDAILPDEEDSPMLSAVKETIADAAEDLIDDAVEKLPQAIETVSSILGR